MTANGKPDTRRVEHSRLTTQQRRERALNAALVAAVNTICRRSGELSQDARERLLDALTAH